MMDWTSILIALFTAKEFYLAIRHFLQYMERRKRLEIDELSANKLNQTQITILEEEFRNRLASEQFIWGADYVLVLNVTNGTYFLRENGPVSELKWKVRIMDQLRDEYDEGESRLVESFQKKPLLMLKGILRHSKRVDGFYCRNDTSNIDKKMNRIMSYCNVGSVVGHCIFNRKNIPETLLMCFWKDHKELTDDELCEHSFSIYNFLTENNTLLG